MNARQDLDKAREIMESIGEKHPPVLIRQEDYDYLMSAECNARLREMVKHSHDGVHSILKYLKGGQIYPARGGPVEDEEDESP